MLHPAGCNRDINCLYLQAEVPSASGVALSQLAHPTWCMMYFDVLTDSRYR